MSAKEEAVSSERNFPSMCKAASEILPQYLQILRQQSPIPRNSP